MNYNNIRENSVNKEDAVITRSNKHHIAIVARRTVASILVFGALSTLFYFSNKKDMEEKLEKNNRPATQEIIKDKEIEKVLTKEEKLDALFDKMYAYASENTITDLNKYYEDHYFDLYGEEVKQDILYLYSANTYKKAQDAGLKREDIIKELDFMYQMQEVPSCFPETAIEYVKNLYSSIDEENESLFMIYGPLSVVAHNETCDKEHVINAAGGISHKGEEPVFETYDVEDVKVMTLSK